MSEDFYNSKEGMLKLVKELNAKKVAYSHKPLATIEDEKKETTVISTYPRPVLPYKNDKAYKEEGMVRFLNGASNYNPFQVFVGKNLIVEYLAYSEITEYSKITTGEQMITIMGQNGHIYMQKNMKISKDMPLTIAIINTDTGIELLAIDEPKCMKAKDMACIRVVNLSFNAGPLSVIVGEAELLFKYVPFKQVTDFQTIKPGKYLYMVTKHLNSMHLMSAGFDVIKNKQYTMYLLNWDKSNANKIKAFIVQDE